MTLFNYSEEQLIRFSDAWYECIYIYIYVCVYINIDI